MFCEVTQLRLNGVRLSRSKWPEPLKGSMFITESDRAANNFKRNIRVAHLWDGYGTPRMRGLATLFEPVILPLMGDGILLQGIELYSNEGAMAERVQVWLCRPTTPGAPPLPPFKELGSSSGGPAKQA